MGWGQTIRGQGKETNGEAATIMEAVEMESWADIQEKEPNLFAKVSAMGL